MTEDDQKRLYELDEIAKKEMLQFTSRLEAKGLDGKSLIYVHYSITQYMIISFLCSTKESLGIDLAKSSYEEIKFKCDKILEGEII